MIKSYKQIHFSYLFLLILVLENANVPPKLKFCVGGREVLSDDSSVSDRLINGSIDTGKHLKYEIKGTCYYNICELAISWKIEGFDQLLPEQRSFLQRKTKVLFLLKKKKTILDHAITVHKSQGSTVDYLQGDLPARKLLEGKIINNLYLGQFYILLSCAKR